MLRINSLHTESVTKEEFIAKWTTMTYPEIMDGEARDMWDDAFDSGYAAGYGDGQKVCIR